MEPLWTQVAAVIAARHCMRAFLDRPVPADLLAGILDTAANAPSTRNNQPWRVAVVTGPARLALADRLRAEVDAGVPARPDYPNRPVEPDPVVEERARVSNDGVLLAKGLDPGDRQARRSHLRDNMSFYGAPVELILHLPFSAPPGAFLEVGFYLQNVMLGLVAHGLGSCPQYSVVGYPDVVRAELDLGPERLIVCGLAVGYPDPTAAVNRFAPPRAPVADFVSWHGYTPAGRAR